jgi:hypothetical protein
MGVELDVRQYHRYRVSHDDRYHDSRMDLDVERRHVVRIADE